MATEVFMPALGMAQETGKLLEWLIREGQPVTKGKPIMVVETDKTSVELEAPASGILVNVTAKPGDDVPVGKVIALIVAESEAKPPSSGSPAPAAKPASPVAARIAEEHGIDLSQVSTSGKRIQKEDVLAYLNSHETAAPVSSRLIQEASSGSLRSPVEQAGSLLSPASPKARRLAREQNIDLKTLKGSGPGGAVLVMDVMKAAEQKPAPPPLSAPPAPSTTEIPVSRMWQVMVQRLTQSWQTVPHFYLEAEANATQLVAWRAKVLERAAEKVTYTDLIVKLVAVALRRHPRLNASWVNGSIQANPEINIGLAIAVEEGLLVPVIHRADQLGITELAARRKALVAGAQANKLALNDLNGGTFTISNLGMYRVDAFSAIVNPPEAAILALGQITDKVVPVDGQPSVQPVMRMVLSVDHRVVDGARGAEFIQTLVTLIENPLAALD